MMTTTSKWLLALGAGACAGAVGVGILSSPPESSEGLAQTQVTTGSSIEPEERRAPAEPRDPGCEFREGDSLAYDISVRDLAELDLGSLGAAAGVPADTDIDVRVRARIELRVLSTDSLGSVLLARYPSIESNAVVEDDRLTTPFLARIGPDCALEGFAHAKDADAGYARVQQALLHELSWSWPSTTPATYQGRGANGSYESIVTATTKPGGASVDQTVSSFQPWSRDPGALTTIAGSHQRVTPGEGPWFERLDARASFKGERSHVEHVVQARLVGRRVSSLEGVPTSESDYVWADLLPYEIPLDERQPPTRAELAALAQAKKLTVDRAVDQYVARVASGVGIHETWPPLRTFLEAKPEASDEIVNMVKRLEIPKEAAMGVYIALGNARTDEARQALEGVMKDERAPFVHRSQAMLSLVDRSDVGLELANYLSERSQGVATATKGLEHAFGRQAVLALGVMSGRKAHDQELKSIAIAQVGRLLAQNRDREPIDQRPIFGALANIGEPDSLELIADIPEHPDEDLREYAAIVFRRMPPGESAEFAARWLARETDPNVKRALWHTIELQTFDAREMTSPEVLRYAIRDLRAKPGVIARKALIRLLGRAIEQMPDDELGIEDVFAEMIPYEYEQKSGFERMMSEHVDPVRREQIYLDVARSYEVDPSAVNTPALVPVAPEPTSGTHGLEMRTSPIPGTTPDDDEVAR